MSVHRPPGLCAVYSTGCSDGLLRSWGDGDTYVCLHLRRGTAFRARLSLSRWWGRQVGNHSGKMTWLRAVYIGLLMFRPATRKPGVRVQPLRQPPCIYIYIPHNSNSSSGYPARFSTRFSITDIFNLNFLAPSACCVGLILCVRTLVFLPNLYFVTKMHIMS